MPNYVKNRLEVIGEKNDILEVIDSMKTEQENQINHFDFNKIIEMPKDLNITSNGWLMPLENQFSKSDSFIETLDSLRKFIAKAPEDRKIEEKDNFLQGVKNCIQYGHATWLSWSRENWGTKWNALESEVKENTIEFDTAWNGVPNLILKLSVKFPKVKFIYKYADEDTGCNCGLGEFENGSHDFKELEKLSNEAYDLAFELRPHYKEDYKIIDGKYEFVDEDE